MGKPIRSWGNTLARLGFTRRREHTWGKHLQARSLHLEHLEQRRLLAIDLSVAGFSACEYDLLVEYDVAGDDASPFDIGIYGSTDGITPETLLMTHPVADPADLLVGTHAVSISAEFADVPEDYYLVAQVDADSAVAETDESNNLAVFQGGIFLATDDTVHVHGTGASDTFGFLDRGGRQLEIWYGPRPQQFAPLPPCSAVHVRAHAGDDEISMCSLSSATTPLWAFGGEGDDLLVGGAGDDLLVGGDGGDALQGGGGRDRLLGGSGTDVIDGCRDLLHVVDNHDLSYVESGTGWITSGNGAPHRGDFRLHEPGSGTNVAGWHFEDLLPDTRYEVFTTFVPGADQATNAAYTVRDGSQFEGTVRVNQRDANNNTAIEGQGWASLGSYTIESGSLTVELSDRADGAVCADAVVLLEVPARPPRTLIDGQISDDGQVDGAKSTMLPPSYGEVMAAEGAGSWATVVGRHVFYNNCSFDGDDPGPGAADDGAIPPTPPTSDPEHFPDIELGKEALRPGRTAQYANFTNYHKGINGIMVDIADLPGGGTIDAPDFLLKVGNDNDPADWSAAPAPNSITVRPGAGMDGSSRITLIWDDAAITQQWLQVTVLANGDTGLPSDDVFYFGNLIADVNGVPSSGEFVHGSDDILAILGSGQWLGTGLTTESPIDFNRDGTCNGDDILVILFTYPEWPPVWPDGRLKQVTVPPVVAIDDFYAEHDEPTETDQLKIDYTIATDPQTPLDSLQINVYASFDGLTPSGEPLLSYTTTGDELLDGSHTVTIPPEFTDPEYDYFLMAVVEDTAAVVTRNNMVFEGVFKATDGTVHLFGSEAAEEIEVFDTLWWGLFVYHNGSPWGPTYWDYSAIHVRAYQGDDVITVYPLGAVTPVLACGGDGNDTINGGQGDATLYGGEGHDQISGDFGNDYLFGQSGTDTLTGGRGDDLLNGGDDDDQLYGSQGDDDLYGGDGDDVLYGNEDADVLDGGPGIDKLYGGPGFDDPEILDADPALAGYSETGIWSPDATDAAFNKDQRTADAAGNQATWEFTNLTPDGVYGVFVTWAGQSGMENAPFTAFDDTTPLSNLWPVDQAAPPVGDLVGDNCWQHLGTFQFASNRLVVRLDGVDGQTVLADAVRVVPYDALPATDIEITDFSTSQDELQVAYEVHGDDASPFSIGIYGSTDGITPETLLMTHDVYEPDDLTGGDPPATHTVTFPAEFYDAEDESILIAKVDAYQQVPETNESNNQQRFSGGIFQTADGTVCVYGTDGPDAVTVTPADPEMLDVALSGEVNETQQYPSAEVSEIRIRVYKGNDTVTADETQRAVDAVMVVYGGEGDDGITSGSGNDYLYGGDGNDEIRAAGGDDLVESGEGASNSIFGGLGSDTLYGGGGMDYLFGDDGTPECVGDANDVIYGQGGIDIIMGGAGDDLLYGGSEIDWMDGDHFPAAFGGNDTLYGEDGADFLRGNLGHDLLYGGQGTDSMWGHAGNDTLYGGEGGDNMQGNEDHDWLFGEVGVDTIHGDAGDDYIDGGEDDGYLYGDDGNDVLNGGSGQDSMVGGNDNDAIEGGDNVDTIRGGTGDDWIDGGAGDDKLYGEDDNDLIYGGPDNDTIEGGSGHDDLFGEAGHDSILGGEGNDILDGGDAVDFIDGGPQLDNPEIIDDNEPGYSKTASGGASWSDGFEDDPFDGVPYHRGHGQPGQPTPTYDYYYDEEVAEGEGTATWMFDYAGTDNVNGIECDVYATWVPPDMPGIKVVDYRVTNESGDTGYVGDLDQGAGPGIPLHDHDWWQVPTNGPNVSHQFADNDWLRVQLEVDSYYWTQWACADAAMVLPRWPELDLATDSNNDGTIDVTPHGSDDRQEEGSPGRIVGVNDSDNRAEVIVNLDPNGYDLSSSQLQLDFDGDGTTITVWSEPTGGTQIHTGDWWALGSETFPLSVWVEGGTVPGTSTLSLSLVDWTTSERPVADKVKVRVVEVEGMKVERETVEGFWVELAEDAGFWQEYELRWTATGVPEDVAQYVTDVEWWAQPWLEEGNAPPHEWQEGDYVAFADAEGLGPAEAELMQRELNDFVVTPVIRFLSGALARLATAVHKATYKSDGVSWEGYDPGDAHTNYQKGGNPPEFGGGDRVFAERNQPMWRTDPETSEPVDQLHDKVFVKVTIDRNVKGILKLKRYLRWLDPDHYSNDPTFDPDGRRESGRQGDDNVIGNLGGRVMTTRSYGPLSAARLQTYDETTGASGGHVPGDFDELVWRGSDAQHTQFVRFGKLYSKEIYNGVYGFVQFSFFDQTNEKKIILLIQRRQPSNNYLVIGGGNANLLPYAKLAADGVSPIVHYRNLRENRNVTRVVPNKAKTDLLTVWRTVYTEIDSMAEPVFTGGDYPSKIPSGGVVQGSVSGQQLRLDLTLTEPWSEHQFEGGKITLRSGNDDRGTFTITDNEKGPNPLVTVDGNVPADVDNFVDLVDDDIEHGIGQGQMIINPRHWGDVFRGACVEVNTTKHDLYFGDDRNVNQHDIDFKLNIGETYPPADATFRQYSYQVYANHLESLWCVDARQSYRNDFWTIPQFGAFQGPLQVDGDGNQESLLYGIYASSYGFSYLFLETIYDWADQRDYVVLSPHLDALSAHEASHTWGIDDGAGWGQLMTLAVLFDWDNMPPEAIGSLGLSPRGLRSIITSERPGTPQSHDL